MADFDMTWARLDPDHVPPEIDTTQPSVARVYDAILGGKDNFAVDRAVAALSVKTMGDGGNGARLNRAMLGRAVRFMAALGISQFLDLGSGLPTVQNTHQIAQSVNPAARVVYVDNDPSVSLHGQALLAGDAATAVVLADVMEPDKLLGLPEVTGLIDFTQPVGLIMNAVIHHMLDEEDPYGVVAAYKDAVVPGSYLQITHFCDAAPEAAPTCGAAGEPRARADPQPRGDQAVLRRLGDRRARACLPVGVAARRAGDAAARRGQPPHAGGRGPQALASLGGVPGRRHPERGGEVPGQMGLVGVAEVGGQRGPVHDVPPASARSAASCSRARRITHLGETPTYSANSRCSLRSGRPNTSASDATRRSPGSAVIRSTMAATWSTTGSGRGPAARSRPAAAAIMASSAAAASTAAHALSAAGPKMSPAGTTRSFRVEIVSASKRAEAAGPETDAQDLAGPGDPPGENAPVNAEHGRARRLEREVHVRVRQDRLLVRRLAAQVPADHPAEVDERRQVLRRPVPVQA